LSLSQTKEETVVKVLSLYESYDKFLLIKDNVSSEIEVYDEIAVE
jgi:sulfur transfer complex TusBCD TusB component (DsrH family)